MDKIIIKEAKFLCNIGISEKERKQKQPIYIDIELFLNTKKAARTDNVRDTINYSEVYDFIKGLAKKKEYNLIETMAEHIAKNILKKFNINQVLVNVKKPRALGTNAKYASVKIIRRKNG